MWSAILGQRSLVVLGREQVAHREAPIGPPAAPRSHHLVLGRKVVESVGALTRAAARDRPESRTSGRSSATIRKPCAVHGPMPGTSVSAASTSSSVIRASDFVDQPPVDEPLRERSQRRGLAVDMPLARSSCGSAASTSSGDGMWPPNRCFSARRSSGSRRPRAAARRPGRSASRRRRAGAAR